MQIEKINKNQIEVVLNLEDLRKNNISVHSFMSNSTKNQALFSNILNLINNTIDFSIKNCEIVIEAFSILSKCSFVLLITRVPNSTKLHVFKGKHSSFKFAKSLFLKFDDFEDFCMFCNSLNNNFDIKSSLYLLENSYFLHIKVNKLSDYFKMITISKEFSNYIYGYNFVLSENSEIIIKDCAVKTAKKYFV